MFQSSERLTAAIANACEVDNETLSTLLQNGLDIEDPVLKHKHMMFLEEIRSQQKKLEHYMFPHGLAGQKGNAFRGFRPLIGAIFPESPHLRYCVTAYTMTHLAIATYIVLITVADQAEISEISELARDVLHQKMAMAYYLEDYIAQKAADAPESEKLHPSSLVPDTRAWGALLAPVETESRQSVPLH